MSESLEQVIGATVRSPDTAGCAAVVAYAFNHQGVLDTTYLPFVLGRYHFLTLAMVTDVAYVAAVLIGSSEEPYVPVIQERLADIEVCA